MAKGSPIEIVRKALRGKLRAGGDIAVAAADLSLLLDEFGRLQQGNDRLRRQNRRLRLKLQRAGVVDEDPATAAGEDAAADVDAPEAPDECGEEA